MNNAAVMCGAGVMIANATDRATLRRLGQLRSSLQPLFDVCGNNSNLGETSPKVEASTF
jgi:hypothetical protein